MKNHTLSLALFICFSGSVYSQNEENPWLFEFGINSINAEKSDKTGYKLPSLSLSRYIFNNFSVGINYSENDINVSINKFVIRRNNHRKNKEFEIADYMRDRLEEVGIMIEDGNESGWRWKNS